MTTETVLGTTTYGVPSGNYDGSSQDWYSIAVQAADYYRGRGNLQTVTFRVTGFEGVMTVEATLDNDAATASWFDTYSLGDGSTQPLTDYHPASIPGNFTWIRIRITGFSGGTIDSVTITY